MAGAGDALHAAESELRRRLGDLATTQDLLSSASDAVDAMHRAACGGHGQSQAGVAGVGITVSSDAGGFRVKGLRKNSPADWVSGTLLAGDRLLAIDGQTLVDKALSEVTALLTGPPNSKVTVEGQRDGSRHPYVITLRRAGKENTSSSVPELCKEALEAIQQMRQQASEAEMKDAQTRKLAGDLCDAQQAAQLHEADAASSRQELDRAHRELEVADQKIKRQHEELQLAKKFKSEVADLKTRFAVLHQRLTESEETALQLRPLAKTVELLEKSLSGKASQLSKTEEQLQCCQKNLAMAVQNEKDRAQQLESFRAKSAAAEASLIEQVSDKAVRISQLEKALREKEGDARDLEMQVGCFCGVR